MMTRPASNELASQAERVIKAADKAGVTLATAESCTAGALATLLANAPGAGEVFHGSFVVYTKEHKVKALGVEAELISRHSAVSEEVAKAMALGALEHSPADVTVAITGASPDRNLTRTATPSGSSTLLRLGITEPCFMRSIASASCPTPKFARRQASGRWRCWKHCWRSVIERNELNQFYRADGVQKQHQPRQP